MSKSIHVNTQLLAGISGEELDKFKKEVYNSKNVLDKCIQILYNIKESKGEVRELDYDTPSWAFKQAHLNGEMEGLQKAIELLTVTEREDRSLNKGG
jgi:hypothetical protein